MPTRFYFHASQTPKALPAFSGMWQVTTDATRRRLVTVRDASQLANGSVINMGAAARVVTLDRQYVSDALLGTQTINGNCSGQLLVQELAANDNVDCIMVAARVVSNNGATTRGIILGSGHYAGVAEFANGSYRNKNFASGRALSSVVAFDGDRIVLEIGYTASGGGTTPQAIGGYGGGFTDLPMNESSTTSGAGWFEISPTLQFKTHNFSTYQDDPIY